MAEITEHLRQHKPEILEAARRCPTCIECAAAIGPSEPETRWGRDRVHLPCGKAAWARAWTGNALPADAPAEH